MQPLRAAGCFMHKSFRCQLGLSWLSAICIFRSSQLTHQMRSTRKLFCSKQTNGFVQHSEVHLPPAASWSNPDRICRLICYELMVNWGDALMKPTLDGDNWCGALRHGLRANRFTFPSHRQQFSSLHLYGAFVGQHWSNYQSPQRRSDWTLRLQERPQLTHHDAPQLTCRHQQRKRWQHYIKACHITNIFFWNVLKTQIWSTLYFEFFGLTCIFYDYCNIFTYLALLIPEMSEWHLNNTHCLT